MTFHPEAISDVQQAVLRRLGPIASDLGFYLAGGTALALQLGHRRSIDFDWFTVERIDPMGLAMDLRERDVPFITGSVDKGTLLGTVSEVQVSFMEYRYTLMQPLLPWPAGEVSLASLDDLACMKLSAVVQRGSKKDFIDIFALIMKHKSLPDLLALYHRKYAAADIGHVLYSLAYFDVADEERTPMLLWDEDWPGIKRAIVAWVQEVAGR